NEDMSRYGAFMYDLDNFLTIYKGAPEPEDEDVDGDIEDNEGTISVPEATDKVESATVMEVATILFNADPDHFYDTFQKYLPETANPTVVKVILGIFLKIVAGAIGKALLVAWSRRDKGMFESLL